MEKLSDISRFKQEQNILLQGFDPISASGFVQVPIYLLNQPDLTANAKVVYSKLLSYAWYHNKVFPGQETMGEDIGMSQPTIARAIQELEAVLDIHRRIPL